MILCYNLLTLLFTPLLLVLLALSWLKKKYRRRIFARLGFGLARRLPFPPGPQPVWMHALSVGEAGSALPLVRALRSRWPDVPIVLSVATTSGEKLARELFTPYCQAIIAAPYDIYPVVSFFIRKIRPRFFVLVETDFWPNWLHLLKKYGVPAWLVNGRMSAASLVRYQGMARFFAPMFQCFDGLCLQTQHDAESMARLGVAVARIHVAGNLKLDAAMPEPVQAQPDKRRQLRREYGFGEKAPLLLCASTHPGEEELLLPAYAELRNDFPELQLLLAPRQIERARAVASLAASLGISCRLRSRKEEQPGSVLLLDTLGELAACYTMADLAFIGGSLVDAGGHNPLEAAAAGLGGIFGPHMEDFSEIASGLLTCGAAQMVPASSSALQAAFYALLAAPDERLRRGKKALRWLRERRGVAARHLALWETYLA